MEQFGKLIKLAYLTLGLLVLTLGSPYRDHQVGVSHCESTEQLCHRSGQGYQQQQALGGPVLGLYGGCIMISKSATVVGGVNVCSRPWVRESWGPWGVHR